MRLHRLAFSVVALVVGAVAFGGQTMILTRGAGAPNRVHFVDPDGSLHHSLNLSGVSDGSSFAIGHLATEPGGGFSIAAMQLPNEMIISNYNANGIRTGRRTYPCPHDVQIVGIGDFNHNTKKEVIIIHPVTGKVASLEIAPTGAGSIFALSVNEAPFWGNFGGPTWNTIYGVADADGDSWPDLLIGNTSGLLRHVYFNNITFLGLSIPTLNATRVARYNSIRGFADINEDGQPDIVNMETTGRTNAWIMTAGLTVDHQIRLDIPFRGITIEAIGKY